MCSCFQSIFNANKYSRKGYDNDREQELADMPEYEFQYRKSVADQNQSALRSESSLNKSHKKRVDLNLKSQSSNIPSPEELNVNQLRSDITHSGVRHAVDKMRHSINTPIESEMESVKIDDSIGMDTNVNPIFTVSPTRNRFNVMNSETPESKNSQIVIAQARQNYYQHNQTNSNETPATATTDYSSSNFPKILPQKQNEYHLNKQRIKDRYQASENERKNKERRDNNNYQQKNRQQRPQDYDQQRRNNDGNYSPDRYEHQQRFDDVNHDYNQRYDRTSFDPRVGHGQYSPDANQRKRQQQRNHPPNVLPDNLPKKKQKKRKHGSPEVVQHNNNYPQQHRFRKLSVEETVEYQMQFPPPSAMMHKPKHRAQISEGDTKETTMDDSHVFNENAEMLRRFTDENKELEVVNDIIAISPSVPEDEEINDVYTPITDYDTNTYEEKVAIARLLSEKMAVVNSKLSSQKKGFSISIGGQQWKQSDDSRRKSAQIKKISAIDEDMPPAPPPEVHPSLSAPDVSDESVANRQGSIQFGFRNESIRNLHKQMNDNEPVVVHQQMKIDEQAESVGDEEGVYDRDDDVVALPSNTSSTMPDGFTGGKQSSTEEYLYDNPSVANEPKPRYSREPMKRLPQDSNEQQKRSNYDGQQKRPSQQIRNDGNQNREQYEDNYRPQQQSNDNQNIYRQRSAPDEWQSKEVNYRQKSHPNHNQNKRERHDNNYQSGGRDQQSRKQYSQQNPESYQQQKRYDRNERRPLPQQHSNNEQRNNQQRGQPNQQRNDYQRNDRQRNDQQQRNDQRNDYQMNERQRNKYQSNDRQRNDQHRNDHQRNDHQQKDYQRNNNQRNDRQRNDNQRNDNQRNDYKRNDRQRNDQRNDRQRNDNQRNNYQRNDHSRNDNQRNDHQRNDNQRNDHQRNDNQRNDHQHNDNQRNNQRNDHQRNDYQRKDNQRNDNQHNDYQRNNQRNDQQYQRERQQRQPSHQLPPQQQQQKRQMQSQVRHSNKDGHSSPVSDSHQHQRFTKPRSPPIQKRLPNQSPSNDNQYRYPSAKQQQNNYPRDLNKKRISKQNNPVFIPSAPGGQSPPINKQRNSRQPQPRSNNAPSKKLPQKSLPNRNGTKPGKQQMPNRRLPPMKSKQNDGGYGMIASPNVNRNMNVSVEDKRKSIWDSDSSSSAETVATNDKFDENTIKKPPKRDRRGKNNIMAGIKEDRRLTVDILGARNANVRSSVTGLEYDAN